jgi:cyclophilin family peptidyl-prolyl cis-trans isomerase/uncharacterized SAM-binding protein YcdF (DUF218 family)
MRDPRIIVVLGCRAEVDGQGRLVLGALAGRLDAGARLYASRDRGPGNDTLVVASGGRRWRGGVEADVMRRELAHRGVPERAIVRERCSLSTWDNARFTKELLARHARAGDPVSLVTCDWHLSRASAIFRRHGFVVEPIPAARQSAPWRTRLWRRAREGVLRWLALAVVALVWPSLVACSRSAPDASRGGAAVAPEGGLAGLALTSVLAAIDVAEDRRTAREIPAGVQNDPAPAVRRRAARALARILDPDDGPLLRALEDEDPEVVAWAAYGLGQSCRSRDDAAPGHVRALAARLASLPPAPERNVEGTLDEQASLLRALGRCGGDQAEQTLRAWVSRSSDAAEAAALALGDIASRRGTLAASSAVVLLAASQRSPPLDAALYPFGRADLDAGPELRGRLLEAARSALGRAGPSRIFAVRALGRNGGPDAAADLSRVLVSGAFTPAERAEAAHALGAVPGAPAATDEGARAAAIRQAALGEALRSLVAGGNTRALLDGDPFGVLLATLRALGDGWPASAEAALRTTAHLEPETDASPAARRRAAALRCAAALRLARGAWDAEPLRRCDVADGEAGESARLAVLEGTQLTKARKIEWAELARSKHIRVRESALKAAGRHPELGPAAADALTDALAAAEPGVVATAAEVVKAHPERVDPRTSEALQRALARPWSEDLVETRVALLDAALAVGLAQGREYARAACADPNATLRDRAARALAAARDPNSSCPAPAQRPDPAPEIGHALAHPTRVTLDTDAGSLVLRFDPALAPVAATRFVALARSGFYSGVTIHRVVPGFVVQLGDRQGDGYGGSGRLLRCETSPVPFGALDVGVALAGRDTGSSQIFVALSRQPHLDGEYAWVGRAEGDWDGVAEGDVVREARVEE